MTEWFGIFAPPATPPAIVNRAATPSPRALADKPLGEVYAQTGIVPEALTPAELAALIKSDSETWTPRIKEIGFQPIW